MFRRRALVYLFAAVILISGGVFLGRSLFFGDDDPASRAVPGIDIEDVVAGFAPSLNAREEVGLINAAAQQDHEALRSVALDHLDSSEPSVRWAANYALSLVVREGDSEGIAALNTALKSPDLDERLAAASGLVVAGERTALPVLIELLASNEATGYVVMPAWRWARGLLLIHTAEDFGLRAADDGADAAASRPAWQAWWSSKAAVLTWDTAAGKFR